MLNMVKTVKRFKMRCFDLTLSSNQTKRRLEYIMKIKDDVMLFTLGTTSACMKCFSLRNSRLHSVLKRTPFELSFSLDCFSWVKSITSCFIFIICSSFLLVSLLDNDLSEVERPNFKPFYCFYHV